MDSNEPTKKETIVCVMGCAYSAKSAGRVGLLAKHIHGGHYDRPCVMYRRLNPSDLNAYGQKLPRGMKYEFATDNQELAQDTYAWRKAQELLYIWPYWIAVGIAFFIGWHRGSFANSINKKTREE